jgi:putative colanic acid biosynthesis acetyltransferase WcaB
LESAAFDRRWLSQKKIEMHKKFSVFQDWEANRGNPKGRIVMVLFRVAHFLRCGPSSLRLFALVYGPFYRVAVEWILGIELPWKTVVGGGLRLDHGVGLVVNDHAVIGRGCHLRHGTTIGHKRKKDGAYSGSPILGDGVDVGANVVILGEIKVGNESVIGAGSVVTKDVPDGSTVAGNPARIIASSR